MTELKTAWEVKNFRGRSARLPGETRALPKKMSEAIRTMYERRFLAAVGPSVDRIEGAYDPAISDIFSDAGRDAGRRLEERLPKEGTIT